MHDLIVQDSNPDRTHAVHLGQAAEFFQISNFDSLQLCSPLAYRDLQNLFGKIYNLLKSNYQLISLAEFLR